MKEPINIIAMQSNRPQDVFYVHWNLGKRCNYDCSYCADSLHDFSSPHRSLENLISIAEKMKKNLPNKKIRIWFTGGEPTVNPNFLDFCKWLMNDGHFFVGLNTNGSRTKEYFIELMKTINVIQFSSHFEYVEFDKFMPVIKATNDTAKQYEGKSVSLNLMMEPEHWNAAIRMVKYCIKHDIEYHLKRIRPKDNFSRLDRQYSPIYTEEQIRFLVDNEYRNVILEEYND